MPAYSRQPSPCPTSRQPRSSFGEGARSPGKRPHVLPPGMPCIGRIRPFRVPAEALTLALAQMSPSERALLGARSARQDLEAGLTTVRIVGHSGINGDSALRDAI